MLKLGIIGVGGMGGHHARSFAGLEGIEVCAVADVNEETARQVAAEIGAAPFCDYRDLIEQGGANAVLIATPHPFHPEVAECAAAHKIHILCEKPIAVSVADADRMIAACAKAGVLFGTMFQMRTDPARKEMKRLVDEGAIGEIHRVTMSAPWYRTQAYYDSGAWRGTWSGEGGGILMNQAPHSLDLFNWIGGMPKKIQGIAFTRLHQIEVENTSIAICDYGDCKVGWLYASTADLPTPQTFEVWGDEGILSLEGNNLRRMRVSEPLSHHIVTEQGASGDLGISWTEVEVAKSGTSYVEVVEAFARAVETGDPAHLVADGRDGLRSLELANAMLLAGFTRREVELPLDRAEYETFLNNLKNGAMKRACSRVARPS